VRPVSQKVKRTRDIAQVVDHLANKDKALGSGSLKIELKGEIMI
jgi:hypothetical protein